MCVEDEGGREGRDSIPTRTVPYRAQSTQRCSVGRVSRASVNTVPYRRNVLHTDGEVEREIPTIGQE